MKISGFRLDRSILAAFVFGWLVYLAFTYNLKTVNAATNPSGLTGQYGCMFNRSSAGFNTIWSTNDIGTQVMAYIDYSTNKSQGLLASVYNYDQLNAFTDYELITSDFTETAVNGVKSTYIQEHSIKDSNNNVTSLKVVMMVVNSGNTMLVSQAEPSATSYTGTWSGVCQKI